MGISKDWKGKGSIFIAYPMLNPPMYAREATLHFGGSALYGIHEKHIS
jgi:hypothetical protein